LATDHFARHNIEMGARPTKHSVLLLAGLFLGMHLLIGAVLILEVGLIFGWREVEWQLAVLAPFPVEFFPWIALTEWVQRGQRH
jgi:hypothetical protein